MSVRAQDIKSGADVLIDCISAPKNFLNAATKGSAAAIPFLSLLTPAKSILSKEEPL